MPTAVDGRVKVLSIFIGVIFSTALFWQAALLRWMFDAVGANEIGSNPEIIRNQIHNFQTQSANHDDLFVYASCLLTALGITLLLSLFTNIEAKIAGPINRLVNKNTDVPAEQSMAVAIGGATLIWIISTSAITGGVYFLGTIFKDPNTYDFHNKQITELEESLDLKTKENTRLKEELSQLNSENVKFDNFRWLMDGTRHASFKDKSLMLLRLLIKCDEQPDTRTQWAIENGTKDWYIIFDDELGERRVKFSDTKGFRANLATKTDASVLGLTRDNFTFTPGPIYRVNQNDDMNEVKGEIAKFARKYGTIEAKIMDDQTLSIVINQSFNPLNYCKEKKSPGGADGETRHSSRLGSNVE